VECVGEGRLEASTELCIVTITATSPWTVIARAFSTSAGWRTGGARGVVRMVSARPARFPRPDRRSSLAVFTVVSFWAAAGDGSAVRKARDALWLRLG